MGWSLDGRRLRFTAGRRKEVGPMDGRLRSPVKRLVPSGWAGERSGPWMDGFVLSADCPRARSDVWGV
jgi:hypothetical protein